MSIPISDKFKPMGIGGYPLMDAEDVEYNGGRLTDFMPVAVTQDEYDAMKKNGLINENTPYLIVSDEA